MPISLGINIASLRGQRQLARTNASLDGVYQRLSSGQRINKASDDAAGLAIADNLRTKSRVFSQGLRNLSDGISLLAIADGAVAELSNIVIRITELAEQSANGTFSHRQREALDEEAQSLRKEYTRIIQSTEFNDRAVLTAELNELRLQAGFGTDGGIASNLGGQVGTGRFSDRTSFATGGSPNSVVTGDFNQDGFIDFAIAETIGASVGIFLGDGTGSFAPRTSVYVAVGLNKLKSGDFNSDGVLDLVAISTATDVASVMFGDGTGTFSPTVSLATGNVPYSVDIGDFNNDGNLDFVTVDFTDDAGSVFLGDGTGGFSSPSTFQAGSNPFAVMVGDLDNDGTADLVVANNDTDTVTVLLGDGTGSFAAQSTFQTGSSPGSVVLGDFNGDMLLDIATGDRSSDSISVLLGDGTGSFSTRVSFGTGTAPESITAGDFNGDGNLDIITGNFKSSNASVLLGDGTGSFASHVTYQTGSFPRGVSTADFNGDGVLDFVSADNTANTASVLLGEVTSGTAPLLDFSLRTMAGARQALPQLQEKLQHLTTQRAQIGVFEARLSAASNVVQASNENFTSAESRVRDTDIAEDSAILTRESILQQATSAVLAQANQQPALVLQLLE